MGNQLHFSNVIKLDEHRSTEEQNRIRLRLRMTGKLLCSVFVGRDGLAVLEKTSRQNKKTSSELFNQGLWTPDMSFALPVTVKDVFQDRLRTVKDETIDTVPVISELDMSKLLMTEGRIIELRTDLFTTLTDAAAKRKVDPDALANAVALSSYSDQDAILMNFDIISRGHLRGVSGCKLA